MLIEKKSLDKIKSKIKASKIFHRLPAEIMIRKAIILSIVLNLLEKKIVAVLATFTLVTASLEALQRVFYI